MGGRQIKGIVQMAVGMVVALVGVALCVLPGPGLLIIAAGVALIRRGWYTFIGRTPARRLRRLGPAQRESGALVPKPRQHADNSAL